VVKQSVDGIQIDRNLILTLTDGTRLSGDLYRPAGAGPGPVLVSYYPYRKDDIIGSLFEGCRIRLCERGYASVFVDMAGTGSSEGSWESFDLSREGRDCAETIEWVAAQEWCDGNVGAWGVSYGGMTALAAATCRPAHLRAIVATYATTDVFRDSISRGGCATMLGRYAWSSHMVALGLSPPTLQDPDGQWRRTWGRRLQRLAQGQPPALAWQAHPEPDAFWQARQVDAAAIEIPTMLIGGWSDTYADAMIRIFGEVGGPKRLVMGPWMHVLPHLSDAEPYDWVAAMADWWDAHLRPGRAPGPEQEAPVLFYAAGEGWRAARDWPPAGVEQKPLFLSGHRLDAEAPPAPSRRRYRSDPTVGIAGGLWDPFGTGNGWPEEQSADDAKSLTFTTEPLQEPLLIAGNPEAELYVALPDGAEAHLVARMSMVDIDDRSTLIASGWRRVAAASPSNTAGRAGPDGPGGPPGDAGLFLQPTTIALGPAAFSLPAGARLRLSVSCADFPRIWPSPTNPALEVGLGPGSASVLRVPVSREPDRGDVAAAVTLAPPGHDAGWVTDSHPAFSLTHDKAAQEVAVTFGARSRLRSPGGADMTTAEYFTARLRSGRPDGAAVLAQVDVDISLSAGEQVHVSVRSASSRRSTVVEASVAMDGVCILKHRWAGDGLAGSGPLTQPTQDGRPGPGSPV
jgi:uncharacterized protein